MLAERRQINNTPTTTKGALEVALVIFAFSEEVFDKTNESLGASKVKSYSSSSTA
jgi:hypothetical protein